MNFSKKINHKMKQKALLTALSDKVRGGQLLIVDELKIANNKTKDFATVLKNLKIEKTVVIGFAGEEAAHYRALRNIPKTNGLPVEQLNTYDVMNAAIVLLSKDAVKFIEEKYKSDKDKE